MGGDAHRYGGGDRARRHLRDAPQGQGGARIRHHAVPLRRVLPRAGRARARRAAHLRDRSRHRRGGHGRGELHARADAHAGRIELHLPLQVRAAMMKLPSQLIDARISELGDWRGETLARIRRLIQEADPEVVEEWKWRGVPVWSHAGIICTGETYKAVVKMTFAKGASLADPSRLFNASLDGNTRRAIDIHEGDKIDETALKALIRAAVAFNTSAAARRPGTRA